MPNPLEEEQSFRKKKDSLLKILKKKKQALRRKLEQAFLDYQESLAWEKVFHEGLLIQSHLYKIAPGTSFVTVEDWKEGGQLKRLSWDPKLSPYQAIENTFKKSKKLKKAIPYKKNYLADLERRMGLMASQLERLESISDQETLDIFCRENKLGPTSQPPKKKIQEKPAYYRAFTALSGDRILVGKKAGDNDKLTFKLAHGNDWWLHVADYPGSHVVIQTKKPADPSLETIEDAMELALYFSKAQSHKEGEICLTQCKFVKKLGGKAGQVTLSSHRRLFYRSDPSRLKRLLHDK